MKQARMRFGSFVWPVNPSIVTVQSGRDTALLMAAGGDERLEVMGNRGRVVEGSGVFPGPEGQRQLEELRQTGRQEAAVLFVPGTAPMTAVLSSLTAEGRPGPEETAYSFRFTERLQRELPKSQEQKRYTAGAGESLWHIAAAQGASIEDLLALNPGIPHPWAVREGQEVAVP